MNKYDRQRKEALEYKTVNIDITEMNHLPAVLSRELKSNGQYYCIFEGRKTVFVLVNNTKGERK